MATSQTEMCNFSQLITMHTAFLGAEYKHCQKTWQTISTILCAQNTSLRIR